MTAYIALIRKDLDSDYGVDFPDFPGCITVGSTMDEARRMAPEALELHIEGMLEDGTAIPEPSSLDAIMADPFHHEAVAFLVDVAARPARAIRLNIVLPEDLVEALDRRAKNPAKLLASRGFRFCMRVPRRRGRS